MKETTRAWQGRSAPEVGREEGVCHEKKRQAGGTRLGKNEEGQEEEEDSGVQEKTGLSTKSIRQECKTSPWSLGEQSLSLSRLNAEREAKDDEEDDDDASSVQTRNRRRRRKKVRVLEKERHVKMVAEQREREGRGKIGYVASPSPPSSSVASHEKRGAVQGRRGAREAEEHGGEDHSLLSKRKKKNADNSSTVTSSIYKNIHTNSRLGRGRHLSEQSRSLIECQFDLYRTRVERYKAIARKELVDVSRQRWTRRKRRNRRSTAKTAGRTPQALSASLLSVASALLSRQAKTLANTHRPGEAHVYECLQMYLDA